MQNPLVTLRELSGKTTTDIGKKAGVTKQYISKAERGFYPGPSLNQMYLQTILNWAAVEGFTLPELKQLYREWQTWKREQSAEFKMLNPVADLLYNWATPVANAVGVTNSGTDSQPKLNPALVSSEGTVYWYKVFTAWRYLHWDSIYAFCSDLCCKPYEVERYEAGQCTRMPSMLETALNEAHLLNGFCTDER